MVNKKNDYAFKRIFGHEDTKDILARFLTVLLDVPIEPEELILIHTELSPEYLADKASVLDIHVRRSAFHEKMNIEIQVDDKKNIGQRILYYWARGYTEDLKEGQDYATLPRMINIVIADFDVFEWRNMGKFHGVFRVLERDEGVLFSDALEIHVVELPKLKRRSPKDEWDPIECWGLYLNNMEGEVMERIAEQEPMIRRAMTVEDIFMKNEEERRFYEIREKGRRDFISAINAAELRGIEKGIEKGIDENKRETARAMLARGMKTDMIADVTGLSVEEVNAQRE